MFLCGIETRRTEVAAIGDMDVGDGRDTLLHHRCPDTHRLEDTLRTLRQGNGTSVIAGLRILLQPHRLDDADAQIEIPQGVREARAHHAAANNQKVVCHSFKFQGARFKVERPVLFLSLAP